ncbi:hypothetical protein JZO70_01010 [Enterococcus sp. 669A]|uniref:Transcriptional regulator, AbiEi antitoxin, Type IV TA system n=1 Tax=Candidatus Enterococcus moelleringii TaxID=2815325 RepID=A0ABS3L536_9ENTE|nr:DUF6088 family protein [Enterococcus sp. 669A]MBO1304723.1 hypothetical protein [Enterococcus sp. 669A]
MTVKSKIKNRIRVAPKGKVFVLSDFSPLGNYKTIQKQINLLVQEGELRQLHRGIYQKPNYNELVQRSVPASAEEIAEAYARKNRWKISPAGDLALNKMGLSTQVPNQYHYVSSGPSKEVKLENGRTITFRHVTQRESNMHPVSAMVIEALKTLGQERVSLITLEKISSRLNTRQFEQLKKDGVNARSWIRDLINKMEEYR